MASEPPRADGSQGRSNGAEEADHFGDDDHFDSVGTDASHHSRHGRKSRHRDKDKKKKSHRHHKSRHRDRERDKEPSQSQGAEQQEDFFDESELASVSSQRGRPPPSSSDLRPPPSSSELRPPPSSSDLDGERESSSAASVPVSPNAAAGTDQSLMLPRQADKPVSSASLSGSSAPEAQPQPAALPDISSYPSLPSLPSNASLPLLHPLQHNDSDLSLPGQVASPTAAGQPAQWSSLDPLSNVSDLRPKRMSSMPVESHPLTAPAQPAPPGPTSLSVIPAQRPQPKLRRTKTQSSTLTVSTQSRPVAQFLHRSRSSTHASTAAQFALSSIMLCDAPAVVDHAVFAEEDVRLSRELDVQCDRLKEGAPDAAGQVLALCTALIELYDCDVAPPPPAVPSIGFTPRTRSFLITPRVKAPSTTPAVPLARVPTERKEPPAECPVHPSQTQAQAAGEAKDGPIDLQIGSFVCRCPKERKAARLISKVIATAATLDRVSPSPTPAAEQPGSEVVLRAWLACARFHKRRGQLAEAFAVARNAQSVAQRMTAPQQAEAMAEMGDIFRLQGRLGDALNQLRQAHALVKKIGGELLVDAGVLELLQARVLHDKGDYLGAETMISECLLIFNRIFGPNDRSVGDALMLLAAICLELGEPKKALPVVTRALAIYDACLYERHPKAIGGLVTLASCQRQLGQLPAAEQTALKVLRLREDVFGPDSREVAIAVTSLAMVYKSSKDLISAAELCERALAIRQQFPKERFAIAMAHNELALVLKDQKKFALAIGEFDRAWAIHEELAASAKKLVKEQGDVAYNSALAHKGAGKINRALELFQTAYRIYKQTLGPDDPETQDAKDCYNQLADEQSVSFCMWCCGDTPQ